MKVDTIQFEAMLLGWSETHNGGAKITLQLADIGDLEPFKRMTIKKGKIAGQLLTCVVVETDGNGDPVPQDAPEPKRGRHGKFPDGLCGLAVRWCEDPDFFRWLRAEFPNIAKNTLPPNAAVLLKSVCGISSRKELDADTPGRATFIKYIKEPYAASRKGRGLDE